MKNEQPSRIAAASEKPFDLEERTARFGEAAILFAKTVKRDAVNTPLVSQLVRAAASIGANYAEADDAESKKDFRHKIGICRKESRETKHWLRMIAASDPDRKQEARALWQEAKELNLILAQSAAKAKNDPSTFVIES